MNTLHKIPHHIPRNHVTIVLADDHTMMREGTRRLLEENPFFVVVGEAQDGTEAIALCQQFHPDVLILDIAMKGMNGFKAAQTLLAEQQQHTAILVLTAYAQTAYIEAMLNIGVKGYWLKTASSREIRQAVHDIAEGKDSFDPEIQQILANEKTASPLKTLTNREQEVLQLVVQGLRNAEISERLHISLKTVETHITSLYNKLGIQSRAEAITFAQKQGLLFEEES